ncbi:uncharacterized protein PG998_011367 [Apiospora kogelbergensis]|uniref:uncharacterized protein n=1 Tax=Apiospora kogelbergensis TaxID=1337665 RepID=UPI00312DFC10
MDSSSRSSSGSATYRSAHASGHKKDVSSHGSKGTVVVNHHARIYEASAPQPGYSSSQSRYSYSGGSSSRR